MSTELVSEIDTAIRLWCNGRGLEETVLCSTKDEVFEFAEVLMMISRHHCSSLAAKNENFSFTANSALSGGGHPCASPACRVRRVESLTTFASLYADEVYIQQPFERIALSDPSQIMEVHRHDLIAGIQTYEMLRPLIEGGIVKYAHDANPFCDHHSATVAAPLLRRLAAKSDELSEEITRRLLECCSVKFDQSNPEDPFFEVSGPEGIVEHGTVYFHAYRPFPQQFRRYRRMGPVHTLTKSEIEDGGVLKMVVQPIVQDILLQEWHTALNGTSYLSDSRDHMELVSLINNESFAANSAAFSSGLKHYLPQIYSQDATVLLALRERESEAFAVYRDKLRRMLKAAPSWDETELAMVFRDEVLPEIAVIEKRIRDWKSNARSQIGERIIFGTGAVTLGLYAGILPSDIGQLVAALGGTSAAAGVLMDWNKTLKDKQQARSSDFYFLWQASQ
ncbi:MAG: hypothetical protein O9318_07280 [Hylemonella sp.]|uniref:hypothetical protein n=1 Tax=Hylemonella sp. TaxID=2066020 RepID=UPI0022C8D9AF|nr:hypothetical protein [Hylemonella sp.]MCZ8252255.1 hypothetical protein [Hylemonella sp.]